jgi:hypothetical protein
MEYQLIKKYDDTCSLISYTSAKGVEKCILKTYDIFEQFYRERDMLYLLDKYENLPFKIPKIISFRSI